MQSKHCFCGMGSTNLFLSQGWIPQEIRPIKKRDKASAQEKESPDDIKCCCGSLSTDYVVTSNEGTGLGLCTAQPTAAPRAAAGGKEHHQRTNPGRGADLHCATRARHTAVPVAWPRLTGLRRQTA